MEFEIKVNDILTFRDGKTAMVHDHKGELIFATEREWDTIMQFNKDLTANSLLGKNYDIMKIQLPEKEYQPIKIYWDKAPVVWERKTTISWYDTRIKTPCNV